MIKKKTEIIASKVNITPCDYGEQIARTVIDWFLDKDTNTEDVVFENEQEIVETAKEVIMYIKDYYGIKEGGEE